MTPDLFAAEAGAAAMADRLQDWDPHHWPVAPDWKPVVEAFLDSPAGRQLGEFIRARIEAGATIFPPRPVNARRSGLGAAVMGVSAALMASYLSE